MLREELYAALCEVPAIDVHSHIHRDRPAAEAPEEILLYHMLTYLLNSADDPLAGAAGAGGALTCEDFADRWPMIRHTGAGWMLETILTDLYDWREAISRKTLPGLLERLSDGAKRPDFAAEIFRKGRIERILSSQTKLTPLAEGQTDYGIRRTVERTPGGGTVEFHGWAGRLRHWADRHFGRPVQTVDDLREISTRFYESVDWSSRLALVAWVTSEMDFTPASDAEVNELLRRESAGESTGLDGRRILEAANLRAICAAIRGKAKVFQFCYGTQYLTPGDGQGGMRAHPVQKAAPQFAQTFAHLLAEFPEIHFNLLNGFENDEPIWASLTQGYPNLSLAGFWWQCVFPAGMHAAWARRLDMVPLNRLMGFFSDGRCADYVYGRLAMSRRVLANVLAERIERGFLRRDDVPGIARELFFETPRKVFLPNEKF